MSTRIFRATTGPFASIAFIVSTISMLVSAAATAQEAGAGEDDKRTSISTQYQSGGRERIGDPIVTSDDFDPLLKTGARDRSQTRGGFAKPGATSDSAQSPSYDFWFYDADVILFNDDDRDGFYHGIDLLFDVDTSFLSADVYAVMYLSYEGGPWNEYAATDDFTIFGASSSDEYVVVTELQTGYPTGSYDLLIEIFDAYDGTFLTSFGPADTSALGYLDLEDAARDAPFIIEPTVVVTHGGGGAADGWMLGVFLLLLFSAGVRKIWRHRNDQLVRIDAPAPYWQDNANHRRRFSS